MSDNTPEAWPVNNPEPLPEDLEPPLLQDPIIRWPPEPPVEDDVECDGSGHDYPPEAVQIAEEALRDG
jgi:hypothetical protein